MHIHYEPVNIASFCYISFMVNASAILLTDAQAICRWKTLYMKCSAYIACLEKFDHLYSCI